MSLTRNNSALKNGFRRILLILLFTVSLSAIVLIEHGIVYAEEPSSYQDADYEESDKSDEEEQANQADENYNAADDDGNGDGNGYPFGQEDGDYDGGDTSPEEEQAIQPYENDSAVDEDGNGDGNGSYLDQEPGLYQTDNDTDEATTQPEDQAHANDMRRTFSFDLYPLDGHIYIEIEATSHDGLDVLSYRIVPYERELTEYPLDNFRLITLLLVAIIGGLIIVMGLVLVLMSLKRSRKISESLESLRDDIAVVNVNLSRQRDKVGGTIGNPSPGVITTSPPANIGVQTAKLNSDILYEINRMLQTNSINANVFLSKHKAVWITKDTAAPDNYAASVQFKITTETDSSLIIAAPTTDTKDNMLAFPVRALITRVEFYAQGLNNLFGQELKRDTAYIVISKVSSLASITVVSGTIGVYKLHNIGEVQITERTEYYDVALDLNKMLNNGAIDRDSLIRKHGLISLAGRENYASVRAGVQDVLYRNQGAFTLAALQSASSRDLVYAFPLCGDITRNEYYAYGFNIMFNKEFKDGVRKAQVLEITKPAELVVSSKTPGFYEIKTPGSMRMRAQSG